jgi:acetyl esterase/lipase
MPDANTLQPLDPPIADLQRKWQASGIPGLYEGGNGPVSRERARCIRAFLYPRPKLPTGNLERFSIPGPAGEILVERVAPAEGAPIGTLVFFHGGGFIIGDIDSHQAHAIRLANRTQVVVLNVDYRLAPEHRFPAAAEDAIAAMHWAAAHLDRLGGRGRPMAVGGDSAGGNLAAVAAIVCRDAGIALAAQLLLYPVTDMRRENNPDVRRAYFGDRHDSLSGDFRASPVVARLQGAAPAIIGVGPHDFLFQDNVAYAAALRAAGVPVTWREYPTLNHGFFGYTSISPASLEAAEQLCDDLRQSMGGPLS